MHPNAKLIEDFYTAFAKLDAGPMVACYTSDATFCDPAFPFLRGTEVGAMWTMLCGRAKDFSLTFRDVTADDRKGAAHWEAHYRFGGKRQVHNIIEAEFFFDQGKIARHVDTFDMHRWAGMAIGPVGKLLGWFPPFQRVIQRKARQGLDEFIASQSSTK